MKTHVLFHQSVALACLVSVLGAGSLLLNAQEKSPLRPAASAAAPEYTLEIVEGQLQVANLKGRVDVSKRWGPGEIANVPATLVNIIDVLRDLHPEANIAMS